MQRAVPFLGTKITSSHAMRAVRSGPWFRTAAASLWAISFLVSMSAPAGAQQQTAQLTGRVQDVSGAAIPGATITVFDPAKGFRITTKSEANGDYFVPLLPPADDYQIRVDMTGFKAEVRQNVSLQVAQSAKIDFVLQVGETTESVTGEDIRFRSTTRCEQGNRRLGTEQHLDRAEWPSTCV